MILFLGKEIKPENPRANLSGNLRVNSSLIIKYLIVNTAYLEEVRERRVIMESNKKPERLIKKPTKKDRVQQQKRKMIRDTRIKRMKAAIVRKKTIDAYEIIDSIRLEMGLSDTAFRDNYTMAKKGLESALGDFLLDDNYWKERLESVKDLPDEELWEMVSKVLKKFTEK